MHTLHYLHEYVHTRLFPLTHICHGHTHFPNTTTHLTHREHSSQLKGACSEIFGKWILSKLSDMVTFPTNTSSMLKKLQLCISFVSNWRKQRLCYLLFYKWWKPRLLISKKVFRWFLLNYTDFAHKITHVKPSKYDSTFGTKIAICLKKVGGMRLWIGTSTFND